MARPDPRIRWIAPIVLVVVVALFYLWLRPKPHTLGEAYVSEKSVTLWTSTAEVRQQVVTLHYGDHVTILAQQGVVDQVRSATGDTGWMDATGLMDPALWQRSIALLKRAQGMEVQARGYAKTVTNVHIEPGRSSDRIYQFARNVPVVILSRAVAAASPAGPSGGDAVIAATPDDTKPKLEDWLLVMRDASAATISLPAESAPVSPVTSNSAPAGDDSTDTDTALPMAGWVLARFIELTLPTAVRDNALSSDLRVVAWFELNRVPGGSGDSAQANDSGASGEMPQYLVAGSRGEEGQACDFTLLRVYTWDDPRQRYETAFLESDLCGKLPIHVFQKAGEPEFKFADASDSGGERTYALEKTVVRRVDIEQKSERRSRHSEK
ncbi:MAG: hypothetical protein WA871_01595 [Candidatus Acidiferrales bacterium]